MYRPALCRVGGEDSAIRKCLYSAYKPVVDDNNKKERKRWWEGGGGNCSAALGNQLQHGATSSQKSLWIKTFCCSLVTLPSPALHLITWLFTRYTRPQSKCHTIATFRQADTIAIRVSGTYGSSKFQFIDIRWCFIAPPFSTRSRSALGPTRPPTQSVLELFPWGYTVWDVKLTTLVPQLRTVDIYTHWCILTA